MSDVLLNLTWCWKNVLCVFYQVAGLISSIIVLITVLKIGALFETLPKVLVISANMLHFKKGQMPFLGDCLECFILVPTPLFSPLWKVKMIPVLMMWLFVHVLQAVLSTIVIVNLKGMFKQFTDVSMLWKTNKVDLVWRNPPNATLPFCTVSWLPFTAL